MSDEQDVPAAGWVDRGRGNDDGTTVTGATATGATAAVVPGQRTEGEPTAPAAPPVAPPAGAVSVGSAGPVEPVGAVEPPPDPVPGSAPGSAAEPPPASTPYPTTPVNVRVRPRPRPRMPRPGDPLIRMGPWAPVAGAALGLLLGVVVVLFLAPAVDTFDQRLSLVFVVLGLSLLGAGGTLLADEVRLLRRGAQAAEARASNVGVIAGLLNGLTPARLLITASAFSLLLSAYVTSGN